MGDDPKRSQQVLTLWVIWAAMLSGMGFMFYFFRGSGGGTGLPSTALLGLGTVLLAASSGIRWFLLPRHQDLQPIMTFAIIGMALAEGCLISGLFMTGEGQEDLQGILSGMAFLGVLQFAPTYASGSSSGPRDFTRGGGERRR